MGKAKPVYLFSAALFATPQPYRKTVERSENKMAQTGRLQQYRPAFLCSQPNLERNRTIIIHPLQNTTQLTSTNSDDLLKPLLTTLTIHENATFITYLFILTESNNLKQINIINYKGNELKSWLGGVFEQTDDLHISIQYNLDEASSIEVFDLFNFIVKLSQLKDFDKIICKLQDSNSSIINSKLGTNSEIFYIDISVIREYVIPTKVRREHFRWQFCGPGRTILKQVNVKSSTVKEHVRKGKRV